MSLVWANNDRGWVYQPLNQCFAKRQRRPARDLAAGASVPVSSPYSQKLESPFVQRELHNSSRSFTSALQRYREFQGQYCPRCFVPGFRFPVFGGDDVVRPDEGSSTTSASSFDAPAFGWFFLHLKSHYLIRFTEPEVRNSCYHPPVGPPLTVLDQRELLVTVSLRLATSWSGRVAPDLPWILRISG